MSIRKQYLKSDSSCKVTFKIGFNHSQDVKSVKLLGDFNNWNYDSAPMKQLKGGAFSQSLKLESGKSYQFRYLVDNNYWEDEPEADSYVSNGMSEGDLNSVISL